jgi:glycosyltransferase involved in cell wall biosynthesis
MPGGDERLKILLVEPYFTGSHAAWAEGYAAHSRHEVKVLSLKGQFWKWRMHGGAVTLAKKYKCLDISPDLILVSDMLDLTTFLALTRSQTARVPTAIYFHENQISYPWPDTDRDILQKRDKHYGFINYTSALAADLVLFNSGFHREAFLEGLPRLLKHFPDFRNLENVKKIADKSRILHLGMDLAKFDKYRPQKEIIKPRKMPETPLLLWNHRWEYDKNPAGFFQVLCALAERGREFRVALLGENFSQKPEEFARAREGLGSRIVQWGYVKSFADYAAWLFQADILPVTSQQDFFGMSVVEAVYCGCYPLLPYRLAYPEILPYDKYQHLFYLDGDDLTKKLAWALDNIDTVRGVSFRAEVEEYAWENMAPEYDRIVEKLSRY